MARERYLLNTGEDTIHANEIVPTTGKEKRQNWWFYHKTMIVIGAIVALLAGSLIYSVVSRVEPDYTVALMTSYTMPEEAVRQLEGHLAQYAEDRNGDGKNVVSVVNYVFSESAAQSDPNMLQASVVKFSADASTGDSIIYLHDEAAFDFLHEDLGGFFLYNDGTPMPDSAVDFENAMENWNNVKALSEFQISGMGSEAATDEQIRGLFDTLRVSVRSSQGTVFEKKEKNREYYEDCLVLYQRLQKGEKLDVAEG